MAKRAAIGVAACVLSALLASPARAALNPLLLFGGPEQEDFLGCVTCPASEFHSIWNADSDYGSPTHPKSIWNRDGRYGSEESPYSPWNRRPKSVPVVVDRAGNFCGNFAVDRSFPGRVTDGYLVWLLEAHAWITEHLDEMRDEFRSQGPDRDRDPCGLPPAPGL
jgi:hypothetical protein